MILCPNGIKIYQGKKFMAKCLVTGGAGFIGSNLVDELIKRGDDVIVVDNLYDGKEENVNPKAKFYKIDIRDLEKIKPVFEGVQYVFHTAALINLQLSIDNPIESHDVNLNGTVNVLLAAREAGVKKVVYSASCSTYGLQDKLPWHEDMMPEVLSPYSVQKYVGELYCRSFNLVYKLPTVSLRYFNVYGQRQKLEGAYAPVMGIFARQRLAGEPMTIFGDGKQRRDLVSVVDVVRANILAAENDNIRQGEIINIGRGKSYSVNELAKMVGGPTVNKPPRIEVKESLADNSLAKKLLNWEPTVDLPDWLEEYKKEVGLG